MTRPFCTEGAHIAPKAHFWRRRRIFGIEGARFCTEGARLSTEGARFCKEGARFAPKAHGTGPHHQAQAQARTVAHGGEGVLSSPTTPLRAKAARRASPSSPPHPPSFLVSADDRNNEQAGALDVHGEGTEDDAAVALRVFVASYMRTADSTAANYSRAPGVLVPSSDPTSKDGRAQTIALPRGGGGGC